ncbi:MAG: exodeoxyribonuclease VII large subunit [Methanomicrobiaceae archaeon]|nr:exodeoxyribonuclease VII large subunit [Methanomicrobiaceae archaeon]
MEGGGTGLFADEGGAEIATVAEISHLVHQLLDDPRLQAIWVQGEVRDCSFSAKGHCYFSLSEQHADGTHVINCAMWRSYARELFFEPRDGMQVLVWGSVEVYEPQGRYQFIVRDMVCAGEGEKHLLVQRWKEGLAHEGLFDAARKKPLPRFPERVGVVTSATGAARRDIEQVIARRFPVEVVLCPAAVQGETAPAEIAAALGRIDGAVDVIIVGRGGGSFEDLFAFNHPQVVRAIAACITPVVSAVGHETDHTLADYAADLRAPTPSAAAELAVPDRIELASDLVRLRHQLRSGLVARVERGWETLEGLRFRLQPRRFQRRIDEEMQRIVDLDERLARAEGSLLTRQRMLLGQLATSLDALNPHASLVRGYCIVEKDGAVVSSAGALARGDRVTLRLADGSASAQIEEVDHDGNL